MELYDETPPDYRCKAGTVGWGCLIAGVVAFDLWSKETLSQACQRGLENDKLRPLILGAIALTGSHLAGIIPEQYDPLKSLAKRARVPRST